MLSQFPPSPLRSRARLHARCNGGNPPSGRFGGRVTALAWSSGATTVRPKPWPLSPPKPERPSGGLILSSTLSKRGRWPGELYRSDFATGEVDDQREATSSTALRVRRSGRAVPPHQRSSVLVGAGTDGLVGATGTPRITKPPGAPISVGRRFSRRWSQCNCEARPRRPLAKAET